MTDKWAMGCTICQAAVGDSHRGHCTETGAVNKRFRYYIVDDMNQDVRGTDDRNIAEDFATDNVCYVIDTFTNQRIHCRRLGANNKHISVEQISERIKDYVGF